MTNTRNSRVVCCNEVNSIKEENPMPTRLDVISYARGKEKEPTVVTNSGERGIVPEEIALGQIIKANAKKEQHKKNIEDNTK